MSDQPEVVQIDEPDWHGWQWTDGGKSPGLSIGYLPGRKSPCLYTTTHGKGIRPLAYFVSIEAARKALQILDHITANTYPGPLEIGATS